MGINIRKMFFKSQEDKRKVKARRKRRSGILSSTSEDDACKIITKYPKLSADENAILTAIKGNQFLSAVLVGARLKNFVDCMYLKSVTQGETLIHKGEKGTHLYISNAGTFEVSIAETVLLTFNDQRVFGELSILYSAKRYATVKVLENGCVWVLDCPVFKQLMVKTAIEEQEEIVSFLEKVPKLNKAKKEKLYLVANLLKDEFFPGETEIVKEGEVGEKFYIVRAGSATVKKSDEGIVGQICKGQFFGELALLKKEFRQATVIADSPGTECLTLTRKQFLEHFGEFEEFINLSYSNDPSLEHTVEYSELQMKELKILRTIGLGGFGRVELVQHKQNQKLVFALKYLKKQDITSKSHQHQVFNEKLLQMSCNSPFIVKMHKTFKDPKYIYFLLEACLGGDLWSLLHKQKKQCFEEHAAKFYTGCILEALNYLHDRGIIYRDLKPENVMVSSNGYLKVTDFGFAKKVNKYEKTYTFVGTAEYVAPEIIQNKGHGKEVDYWALGVLIYEMLTGRTPFKTNDPGHLQTYKLILRGIDSVVFPTHITPKAKQIIKRLCRPLPVDRLGCQKGGAMDIRNHRWFSQFKWEELKSFSMKAPVKILLDSKTDTSYFEKIREESTTPLDDYSTWDIDF